MLQLFDDISSMLVESPELFMKRQFEISGIVSEMETTVKSEWISIKLVCEIVVRVADITNSTLLSTCSPPVKTRPCKVKLPVMFTSIPVFAKQVIIGVLFLLNCSLF